jgi:hypothetical protein
VQALSAGRKNKHTWAKRVYHRISCLRYYKLTLEEDPLLQSHLRGRSQTTNSCVDVSRANLTRAFTNRSLKLMNCKITCEEGHDVQTHLWRGSWTTNSPPKRVTMCKLTSKEGHELQTHLRRGSRCANSPPKRVTNCKLTSKEGHDVQFAIIFFKINKLNLFFNDLFNMKRLLVTHN